MTNHNFIQLGLFSPALDTREPEISIETKPYISPVDSKLALLLKSIADKMQVEIDNKRNSSINNQHLTGRRLRMLKQLEADAQNLENIQTCIKAIALSLEQGNLDKSLRPLKTKAIIEQIYLGILEPQTRLQNAGISLSEFNNIRKKLLDLMAAHQQVPTEEVQRQRQLRQLEREVAISNFEHYFPTPPKVVELILEHLDLQPGMLVLEPSAGAGHIASALRDNKGVVETIEINPKLAEILKLKNFPCEQIDFLKYYKKGFPRIAMNPPFKYDIAHVRHAFDNCLEDGGILVAIMSAGAFFRSGRQEVNFQSWIRGSKVLIKKLPSAFLQSHVPTGVEAKLVVLKK